MRCAGSGALGTGLPKGYRRVSFREPHLTSRPIKSWLLPLALLAAAWCIVVGVRWWASAPVMLAQAPIDPSQKLECVSYAPFRGDQTPLESDRRISAEQIAQDLKQLAEIT